MPVSLEVLSDLQADHRGRDGEGVERDNLWRLELVGVVVQVLGDRFFVSSSLSFSSCPPARQ